MLYNTYHIALYTTYYNVDEMGQLVLTHNTATCTVLGNNSNYMYYCTY